MPGSKIGKMVGSGPFIVENLKQLAETGRPAFSGAMVSSMAPLMAFLAPARSRTEHWPLDAAAWKLRRAGAS